MSQYATTPLADRDRVSSHENERRPHLVSDCIVFCQFRNWSIVPWFALNRPLSTLTSKGGKAQIYPDLTEDPICQRLPLYHLSLWSQHQWRDTEAEDVHFILSHDPSPLCLPVSLLKQGAGPRAKGAPSKCSASLLRSDHSWLCLPHFLKWPLLCHHFLPLWLMSSPKTMHWTTPRVGRSGGTKMAAPPHQACSVPLLEGSTGRGRSVQVPFTSTTPPIAA